MGFFGPKRERWEVWVKETVELRPGESVEVVSVAAINPPTAKAQTATLVASAAVSVALGGGMIMMQSIAKSFVVLTNQRLLVVRANQRTGKPVPGIAWATERSSITATDARQRNLWRSFEVIRSDGLVLGRFDFPRPNRADCDAMASLLQTPIRMAG